MKRLYIITFILAILLISCSENPQVIEVSPPNNINTEPEEYVVPDYSNYIQPEKVKVIISPPVPTYQSKSKPRIIDMGTITATPYEGKRLPNYNNQPIPQIQTNIYRNISPQNNNPNMVWVNGYYRQNGTWVDGYWRRRPNR